MGLFPDCASPLALGVTVRRDLRPGEQRAQVSLYSRRRVAEAEPCICFTEAARAGEGGREAPLRFRTPTFDSKETAS